MATTVAIAQRKEAAIKRVQAAAVAMGIEPAALTGASRDPDTRICEIFEGIADALEGMKPGEAARGGSGISPVKRKPSQEADA